MLPADDGAEPGRVRYLKPQEEKTLISEQFTGLLRPIVFVGWLTGARASEICFTRVEDVDFEQQTIWIRKSKSQRARMLTLHPTLHKELQEHLAAERIRLKGPVEGALFKTRTKADRRPNSVSKAFGKLAKKLRIKDFTFHDLRHATSQK